MYYIKIAYLSFISIAFSPGEKKKKPMKTTYVCLFAYLIIFLTIDP